MIDCLLLNFTIQIIVARKIDIRYIGFMEKKLIKPIKRLSLREEVYASLKKAIVQLDFKPGQRLHDKELAEEFGVSRTPVREALKRLEDEGLIESVPGSATRVTPLNTEEAKHAFIVAAALHALAGKLAVPHLQETDLKLLESCNEKFKRALEKADVSEAIEADEAFHHVFLEAAGNPEIICALERILPKIRRLEMSQFGSVKGFKSVEQHHQIIQACKEINPEQTAQLIEENWLSLGELLTNNRN